MTTSKRQRWRTLRQQLLFQCVLGAADVWDNKQPVCNFLKANVCASSLHTGRGRLMSYIPSRKRNFRLAAHKSDSKGCSWRQRCPPGLCSTVALLVNVRDSSDTTATSRFHINVWEIIFLAAEGAAAAAASFSNSWRRNQDKAGVSFYGLCLIIMDTL